MFHDNTKKYSSRTSPIRLQSSETLFDVTRSRKNMASHSYWPSHQKCSVFALGCVCEQCVDLKTNHAVSCLNYESVAAHQLTEIPSEFFEISVFHENKKRGCFIFVILSHHKVEAELNLDVIKKIQSIICETSNLMELSKQYQHIKTGCDFFLCKLTFSGIFKPVCHMFFV